MKKSNNLTPRLIKDTLLIGVSIVVAITLVKSGLIGELLTFANGMEPVSALISGFLFSSFFTTPISIAGFISLTNVMPILPMALYGALGAVTADIVIFIFTRHTFQKDFTDVISLSPYHKIRAIFRRRYFRWIIPFIGALIIASPLPDELGIMMLGVSKMRLKTLISISFVMNAIGIAIIGLFA